MQELNPKNNQNWIASVLVFLQKIFFQYQTLKTVKTKNSINGSPKYALLMRGYSLKQGRGYVMLAWLKISSLLLWKPLLLILNALLSWHSKHILKNSHIGKLSLKSTQSSFEHQKTLLKLLRSRIYCLFNPSLLNPLVPSQFQPQF